MNRVLNKLRLTQLEIRPVAPQKWAQMDGRHREALARYLLYIIINWLYIIISYGYKYYITTFFLSLRENYFLLF